MGEIIGGILGGVGSIGGALIQADAAEKARKQALTGYNYLTEGPGKTANNAFINYGTQGVSDANTARRAQMELLGLTPSSGGGSGGGIIDMTQGPDGTYSVPPNNGRPDETGGGRAPINTYANGSNPANLNAFAPGGGGGMSANPNAGTHTPTGGSDPRAHLPPGGVAGGGVPAIAGPTGSNAFNNYLNSTGYKFQLGQGQDAVTSNAAARGLLNSGGTAKALTKYGQDLASTTFNNYLAQLGGITTQGQNAGTLGQNQLTTVANTGTGAGSQAAGYITEGGNAWTQGLTGGLGSLANVITNLPPRTGGTMARNVGGGVA